LRGTCRASKTRSHRVRAFVPNMNTTSNKLADAPAGAQRGRDKGAKGKTSAPQKQPDTESMAGAVRAKPGADDGPSGVQVRDARDVSVQPSGKGGGAKGKTLQVDQQAAAAGPQNHDELARAAQDGPRPGRSATACRARARRTPEQKRKQRGNRYAGAKGKTRGARLK